MAKRLFGKITGRLHPGTQGEGKKKFLLRSGEIGLESFGGFEAYLGVPIIANSVAILNGRFLLGVRLKKYDRSGSPAFPPQCPRIGFKPAIDVLV